MNQKLIFSFKDAITAMKRLDEFFSYEEIKQSSRLPLPVNSDDIITVV